MELWWYSTRISFFTWTFWTWIIYTITNTGLVQSLPVVDKGVFVITGVRTCRFGQGYCILGQDCTVDNEFKPDSLNGHCDGLKKAFTPRAQFVCCELANNSTTTSTSTSTSISSNEGEGPEITTEIPSTSKSTSIVNVNQTTSIPITLITLTSSSQSSVESVESVESINSNELNSTNQTSVSVLNEHEQEPQSSTTTASVSTSTTTTDSSNETNDKLNTRNTSTTIIIVPPSPSSTSKTPTTTIVYEEVTEINIQESITLQIGCGVNRMNLQDGQHESSSILGSTTCWTAAITRRPHYPSSGSVLFHESVLGVSPYSNDPGSFICTGAIIHPSIILTTSTCIARISQDPTQYQVLFNYKHIPHPSHLHLPLAGYRIQKLIQHEGYKGVGKGNDIGIILIENNSGVLSNDDEYCTVCVGSHGAGDCIVSGYSHPNEASDSDGLLHEAVQVLLPKSSKCNENGNKNGQNENIVCGAGRDAAEACFSPRDSGSPLACTESSTKSTKSTGSNSNLSNLSNVYNLRGLFSHGFHCGSIQSPVMYTDVNKYTGWIRQQVGELLLDVI